MRGLFFKIFAIFWLAQSLIFVISTTLIVRQRFSGPGNFAEALDSNLQHNANLAMRDYLAGGCSGFARADARFEPAGAALLQANGEVICRTPNTPALTEHPGRFPDRVDGRQTPDGSVWFVPVVGLDGARYEYAWFQLPSTRPEHRVNLMHFAFPQLPVAIAVGGLTTFVLVLLFSRPLVRLRKAARALAEGNLSVRVEQTPAASLQSHSDEFQGLVHDFNHMAERLESLVGAQRLLLRDVSHELRSPLSRLSVALELAREDANPELGEHLARIEREGEKLNQLIGQLLTLSSMEARESTATFKPLSLNEICEQILPDAEYEAQRRPCTVLLQQDAACTIRGDWELLYRAIENVVRNAIRYTGPGTQVAIRIGEAAGDAKRMAMIEIMDRGPGIPDAELELIFRPFYRVDEARSTSTGGFGVGLAITERAVRLHGGTLRAINRADGGTTIQMIFPEV
ncbi:two-component system, OmpR family, sensor histidine kinase CpxA [Granulicella rosea]|uniref:histidine kinase n=1 Tax=Granulicella rosea TaxID=474952 RepID=A0A239GX55_9BACT|nr:ATP-binding protein [Granulicella rosea]SNS72644.1 two-component system, OmpR family, sensor histidine kinase CpxA [Granulicella rosea]